MRRDRKRGALALELGAALTATTLLGVAAFDVCYPVFVQGTLNHAVRAGVDRALSVEAPAEDVREVVIKSAFGLLDVHSEVEVSYRDALGRSSARPEPGGLVTVGVSEVPAIRLLGGWWGSSLTLAARAVDQLP